MFPGDDYQVESENHFRGLSLVIESVIFSDD
jgi:hypothetical protein